MSYNSAFLRRTIHFKNVPLTSQDLEANRTLELGQSKPREMQRIESLSENVSVWYAVHANSAFGLYYLKSETVIGVSYYEMVSTNVRSETRKFPGSANFQQDGAPLTFPWQSVLFWLECFRNAGVDNTVQQLGKQNYPT